MMKRKLLVYPAIFTAEGDSYNVVFPDIPEAITFGNSFEEALEMAQDAMGLALYDQNVFPEPSMEYISEEGIIVYVTIDIERFRQQQNGNVVKKNTTIPQWLNQLAIENKINFSNVLTEALREKLNV